VVLMADEVVGHMVERVSIPPQDQIAFWERKIPPKKSRQPFEPFRVDDEDLVPPMVHAGEGYRIHFTGLTHDERGYPDMSAETHHRLVTRLVEKIRHNVDSLVRIEEHFMDDARIAVIAFGCTARSARRAVREARQDGIPVGFVRLISLWPFPEKQIKSMAERVDAFIVAEMNLGQMALEVERHVRQPVVGVHHAGGAMMQPEFIQDAIQEVAKSGNGHRRR
jgi:2-oxoglutarate ferredoxin oxidoreductase subunit alpha